MRKKRILWILCMIALFLPLFPQRVDASGVSVERKSIVFQNAQGKPSGITAETASVFPISEDETANIGLQFHGLPQSGKGSDKTVWTLRIEKDGRGMREEVSPGNLNVPVDSGLTVEVTEGRSSFFADYYAAEGKKSYKLVLSGTVDGEPQSYYAALDTKLLPQSALERSGAELKDGALKAAGSALSAEVVLPASEQGNYFEYGVYDESGALVFASDTAGCAVYRSVEDGRYAFLGRSEVYTPGAVLQLLAELPTAARRGTYTIRLRREGGDAYTALSASVRDEDIGKIQVVGELTSNGVRCHLLTDGIAPGEVGLRLLCNGVELKGLWELTSQRQIGTGYEAVRVLRDVSLHEGIYTVEAWANGRRVCAEEMRCTGKPTPLVVDAYRSGGYMAQVTLALLGATENEIYRAYLFCGDACVSVCESAVQQGLLDVEFLGAGGMPESLQQGKNYRIQLRRNSLQGWITVFDYALQRKNAARLENLWNYAAEDTEKLFVYFFQPLCGAVVYSCVLDKAEPAVSVVGDISALSEFRQYKMLIYRGRDDCILTEPQYIAPGAILAEAGGVRFGGEMQHGTVKCYDSETGEEVTEFRSGREIYVQAIPDEGYVLKTGSITVNGETLIGRSFMSSGPCTVSAEFIPDCGAVPIWTGLRYSSGTARATVSGLDGEALLWFSAYDANGGMRSAEVRTISADGEYRFTVSDMAAAEVRCFLTGAERKPISETAKACIDG